MSLTDALPIGTPPTTPCDARPTRCDDTPKVSACLAVSTASLKASVAVVPGAMVARSTIESFIEMIPSISMRRAPAAHLEGVGNGHEAARLPRSEEHTSELQSLMRHPYDY